MKTIKSILLSAMAAVFIFSAAGCQEIEGLIGQAGDAVSGNSAEDNKIAKHNAYIDLYNELVDDFFEVLDDYVGEFGWDEEVYIEDGFSGFSMYSTDAYSLYEKAAEYADKEPAEEAADAAVKALGPTLKTYTDALAAAKNYYSTKGYVDDKFAKAQEYHDVIYGKYDAVETLIDNFLYAVDLMLEGQTEEELAYFKENGQMVHYYGLSCLDLAQQMCAYLYDNEIEAENILDLNMDEFRPIYDRFAEAYNGFNDTVNSSADAAKDEGIITLSTFSRDLDDLKSCASELVSRVENGKGFSDTELMTAFFTDGTPDKLSSLTSSILSGYNSWFA